MPPEPVDMLRHLQALEAGLLRGRRWIVAMDILVAAATLAAALRARGAADVLAIGASRGVGELPELPPGRTLSLDVQAQGIMGAIRAAEAALDALPPALAAQVEAFDPSGGARVIRALFSAGRPVAGRRTWGARPAAWQALEDKTVVDALCDDAGVPRAPSRVVEPTRAALAAAAAALDQGQGVVVAGDSREGFHGAATGTRWLHRPEHLDAVLPTFAGHHDRVRVMPFVDGVPCSMHGLVLRDAVLALRPAEMVVLRRPGHPEFTYVGVGTFWDPSPAQRAALQGAVRRMGAHLRERVGYRGAFTLDGVMGPQGFVPTEVNPRIGAALYAVFGADVSLDLLNGAMVEDLDLDWRPAELERWLIARADAQRGGRGGVVLSRPPELRQAALVLEGGRARPAAEGEPPALHLSWGPSPAGSYVLVRPDPAQTPVGPAYAPRVAAALAWADAAWGLGLGALEAAPERGG